MATVKDIAKKADTSIRTVSLVLNGKHEENRISEKTAKRVLQVAKSLNYRPSSSARNMRNGSFNAISMLLGANENRSYSWFPMELTNSIGDELARHNINMLMARVSDAHLVSKSYVPKILSEQNSDGFLVNYIVGMPKKFIDLVHQYSIPAIWMNVKLKNDCVYPDDFNAGYKAADYLIRKGHRKIGYVGWGTEQIKPHYSIEDRMQGYFYRMEEEKLEPITYLIADPDSNILKISPFEWIKAMDFPTSVIAYKEMDAIRLKCAAAENGMKVPEDLSIFTFTNSLQAPHIPLTSVKIPFEETGRISVDTLLKKIKQPSKLLPPVPVKGEIIYENITVSDKN
jgi:LacI family transcriptional regulator